MTPTKITAIICTYNRAELSRECLLSLMDQTADSADYEILVIDNNSKDDTAATLQKEGVAFPNFRYIFEPIQGLSQARNTGWQNANSPYIIYVDDDAKAATDFVERALWVIEERGYDIFGGVYLPWYKHGRPRWYKDQYGSNKKPYTDLTALKGEETLAGGVLAAKTSILKKFGGFSTKLGMNGEKVAYGEETELQNRMRRSGIPLMYDPKLIIYHLVPKYKMNVFWFMKAAFAGGRDRVIAQKVKTSNFNLFLIGLTAMGMMIVHLLRYTPKLASKNYHIETWMIDVFRKIAKRIGIIYTALMMKYGDDFVPKE